MIIDVENPTSFKMNVKLKNGREYLGKDMVPRPFGEHDRVVAFLHEGAVMVFPLADVECVQMYLDSTS